MGYHVSISPRDGGSICSGRWVNLSVWTEITRCIRTPAKEPSFLLVQDRKTHLCWSVYSALTRRRWHPTVSVACQRARGAVFFPSPISSHWCPRGLYDSRRVFLVSIVPAGPAWLCCLGIQTRTRQAADSVRTIVEWNPKLVVIMLH